MDESSQISEGQMHVSVYMPTHTCTYILTIAHTYIHTYMHACAYTLNTHTCAHA